MELLLNTLKWSAVVGAAALVLWLLKPRMDRRYSPKWRYWAWLGLAAALLLAPVPWGKLLPEETAIAAPVVVEVPYYQVTVGDMTGLRAQSYREGDDPQKVLPPDRERAACSTPPPGRSWPRPTAPPGWSLRRRRR